jgi:hypothetical protein
MKTMIIKERKRLMFKTCFYDHSFYLLPSLSVDWCEKNSVWISLDWLFLFLGLKIKIH